MGQASPPRHETDCAVTEDFARSFKTAILAERLATLAIILIARPKGLNDTLKQAQEDPHVPPCGWTTRRAVRSD